MPSIYIYIYMIYSIFLLVLELKLSQAKVQRSKMLILHFICVYTTELAALKRFIDIKDRKVIKIVVQDILFAVNDMVLLNS